MAYGYCCHLLLLCLTSFLLSFSNANDDSATMLKLFASKTSPTPPTWKTNNNSFCNWEGISCDNSNRVTDISLGDLSLDGTLPSDLNNLSHLKTLDLRGNSFSGALPTLANLTLLEDILLDYNNFTSIPLDFFLGLTNLHNFSISYNSEMEPWSLPIHLTQCTNLYAFYAQGVNIIGSIPDAYVSFPNLHYLILSNNNLNGSLPSHLNNLSHLKILLLGKNSLSGALPTLANLAHLQMVYLGDNRFTSIPLDCFLGLNKLQLFNISGNSDLEPWVLPYELTQNSKLEYFYADNANIMGSIPDTFSISLNLRELSLSYNNLTGTLPATFDRLPIRSLILDNQLQGLSGKLDVISSMTQLEKVWLQANAFSGAIPDLSNCTNLYDLQLRDNRLTGLVHDSLMSLSNLVNVTLQNNRLQGQLPVFGRNLESGLDNNSFCLPTEGKCDPQVTTLLEVARDLGYPFSLTESWKGNDACRAWNFVTCDSSGKNVTIVNFGKQKFPGTISPSFANLTWLRNLSLNENNLMGLIPESLKSLRNLEFLDVSNNNLSPPIPEFSHKVQFLGDNNPLFGKHNSSGTVSVGMVIGIVICVTVLVGIVLLVSYNC